MDYRKYRLIISVLLALFCLLQIINLVSHYMEQRKIVLPNPFFPQELLSRLADFTIFMSAAYGIVLCINIFYLIKKKYFVAIVVVSVVAIILLRYFITAISKYFIES